VPEPEEPEWLSTHEQVVWVALAGVLIKLPGVLDAQLQRDSGLNLFEYFVLSNLSQRENHTVRMSDLASLVNGSLSRLSNVAKRLEQRGWMRREPAPDNGRYTNAVLTDSGWKLVQAAAPGHVRAVRHFVISALTAEQACAVGDACTSIMQRIEPGSTWP
jgi:DNA-binding MarR family transcriptional regulator